MVFLECGAVCFAFCGFVALRLGYVARKWMLGVGCLKFPIVGFGRERVGRNVLSVVVVSSLVCYRMFTVCGVWLFGFAMLV